MSVRVAAAVWEHSRAREGSLIVLLAIADFANAEGVAWPSIGQLARLSRLSERQVQRAVRDLRRMGELEIQEGGGRHQANVYKVALKGDTGVTVSRAVKGDSHVTVSQPLKGDSHVTVSQPLKGDTHVTVSKIKGDMGGKERVTSETERVTPEVRKGDTHVTPTVRTTKEPSLEPSRARARAELILQDTIFVAELRARFPSLDWDWEVSTKWLDHVTTTPPKSNFKNSLRNWLDNVEKFQEERANGRTAKARPRDAGSSEGITAGPDMDAWDRYKRGGR